MFKSGESVMPPGPVKSLQLLNTYFIMKQEYYYLYKISCLLPDKPYYYYGVHKTKNLNDGYFGSGVKLLACIKGLGKENFKKEILQFGKTYGEVLDLEKAAVGKLYETDPWCLNLKGGGENSEFGEVSRLKKSEAMKLKWKDEEFRRKVTEKRNKTISTPEFKKKFSEVLHSKEYREKLSNAQKKAWASDPERKTRASRIQKELGKNPERRRQQSERLKTIMNEPVKHEQLMRKFHSDGFRKKQSENTKKLWQDPEFRQKHIAIRNSSEYKEKIFKKMQCPYCGASVSRNNYKRHVEKHTTL